MKCFHIRNAILPTAKQNPNPFISKGSHGSVMPFPSREKLVIVTPSPFRCLDGVAGPLMECLAQKPRISLPTTDRSHVATLFHNGSDTGI